MTWQPLVHPFSYFKEESGRARDASVVNANAPDPATTTTLIVIGLLSMWSTMRWMRCFKLGYVDHITNVLPLIQKWNYLHYTKSYTEFPHGECNSIYALWNSSPPTTHLATMVHVGCMIILKEPRLTPPLCCKKLQSTISSGNELQVSPILRVQPSFRDVIKAEPTSSVLTIIGRQ